MSEHHPFIDKLKGVISREQQTEPSPEQLQTLHRMREILLTEGHPGMRLLDLTEVWYERMTWSSPREKVELINSLYQKVAGNQDISFRKDFPTLAKRLEDSFKPPPNNVKDFGQITDFELSPLEKFDKYVNEYLESSQPHQVTGEPTTPSLPPTAQRE